MPNSNVVRSCVIDKISTGIGSPPLCHSLIIKELYRKYNRILLPFTPYMLRSRKKQQRRCGNDILMLLNNEKIIFRKESKNKEENA